MKQKTTIETLKNAEIQKQYNYKVSIIVPCYNVLPWLDKCLQSLVNQTLQDIEIICINDGSTDDTDQKLDEWEAQYPNKIKVIHQTNGGSSKARNTGMAIAQGEYIGFVDADDYIDICMYAKLYKEVVSNNVEVIMCNHLEFTARLPKKTNNINLKSKKVNNIEDIFNNATYFWCGLYKFSFLQKHKINFVNDIFFAEDHIFAYYIAINIPSLAILPDKLYYYRKQRQGQLTLSTNKRLYNIFKVFTYLENINNKSNTLLIKKILLRQKIYFYALYAWQIDKKYKIDFLFTAAKNIFSNFKAIDVYKNVLVFKYKNYLGYPKRLIAIIIFHCCYLWQRLQKK